MSPRPPGQVSMPSFPSMAGPSDEGESFLFTRDLPLGVLPTGGKRDQPEYDVRLEPANRTLELLLVDALDIGHSRSYDLCDALVEFVHTTTQYLAYFGEVYFELVPTELVAGTAEGGKDQSDGEATAGKMEEPGSNFPTLAVLPPGKIRRIPFRYLQMIPKGDRERVGGKPFIAIPAERIWHLKLPASIGSPRAHRRMIAARSRPSWPRRRNRPRLHSLAPIAGARTAGGGILGVVSRVSASPPDRDMRARTGALSGRYVRVAQCGSRGLHFASLHGRYAGTRWCAPLVEVRRWPATFGARCLGCRNPAGDA